MNTFGALGLSGTGLWGCQADNVLDMFRTGSRGPMHIFAGNSHPDLVSLITDKLGVTLGNAKLYHKSNRETVVEIGESVRGKDVYIIQTGTKNVNNDVMEMLIVAYACRTAAAKSIVGVIPYLPYCKQSKMRKRGCVVSKLLASMMCKSGFNHIITMDLHQKEIQGFFDIPVDNLRASPFLIQYIRESIPDYRNAVIVARHPGAVRRATSYAERLRLGIAVVHGEEKVPDTEKDDGRSSPPLPDVETRNNLSQGIEFLPGGQEPPVTLSEVVTAKEKPPINVVGDVGGRIAIVVDDMVDDVESFVSVAELLKERGAYKIYVMATHGLLSADAPRLIEDSAIHEVVVTNTVPHDIQKMQCHKIKTVDISSMLAEAMRRIHNGESMSHLFQHISIDD